MRRRLGSRFHQNNTTVFSNSISMSIIYDLVYFVITIPKYSNMPPPPGSSVNVQHSATRSLVAAAWALQSVVDDTVHTTSSLPV